MKPYKLITTDNPGLGLGERGTQHYTTMLDAANAFAWSEAPYRTVIYDDEQVARELKPPEQRLLDAACDLHGIEVKHHYA